jgi:carbon monoxide dehydrogenase subunit G
MKVTGSSVLHAPPDRVWQAVTDPAVLAGVIPGCDGLTPLGPDRFRLTVTLGVASIKGSYTGEVSFRDMQRPSSLILRAAGAGAPGTIDTTVAVTFTDLDDTTTRVDYDAEAVVGGMVGGVGQRVLGAVAKRTADAFFAAIDGTFTAAPEPAMTGAAPAAPGALPRVGGPPPPQRVPPPARGRWDLLEATAAGAISMLVGILVGIRIGRSRPRPRPRS